MTESSRNAVRSPLEALGAECPCKDRREKEKDSESHRSLPSPSYSAVPSFLSLPFLSFPFLVAEALSARLPFALLVRFHCLRVLCGACSIRLCGSSLCASSVRQSYSRGWREKNRTRASQSPEWRGERAETKLGLRGVSFLGASAARSSTFTEQEAESRCSLSLSARESVEKRQRGRESAESRLLL